MAIDSAAGKSAGKNLLAASGFPLFFEIENFRSLGCPLPENRHGQSVRVWARSLTVMQKEAIVFSAHCGKAWRLSSDEGPYLQGHDFGPCPLSFLTAGMVASSMSEILALAQQRGIEFRQLELVQHNNYAMNGSVLQGTMQGSALPVELEVRADCDLDDAALHDLVSMAVHASPLDGLMRKRHPSLFTLSRNGEEVSTAKAQALESMALPAPVDYFRGLHPATDADPGWIGKIENVKDQADTAPGVDLGLQPEQKRSVRLKGICRLRSDGIKEIRQEMNTPPGSTFRFLSDEAEGSGGHSRAPDAVSYISAGIAFCFMTQLGRYASIAKKNLAAYDLIQDTHFSLNGASGGSSGPGIADPVETHLYLATAEDDAFARQCLDMGEQTCYLHALCRTELDTRISIKRIS